MSILLRQTGLALPMATMTPNILTGTLIEHGRSCICSMPVTWVDISNFLPSRLQTWRKQLLALRFGWPLAFLARHHAGPFINLIRQNPVLQIQRPLMSVIRVFPLSTHTCTPCIMSPSRCWKWNSRYCKCKTWKWKTGKAPHIPCYRWLAYGHCCITARTKNKKFSCR